ncbi:hypothetical protein KIPB_007460 [Kipferlia bialata]|uniref:Uncharacterized protein n=1 Tax=Kipferlia bialata TaxID=797122 RepID=A0A9K3GKL5_9EUKA|nr:hypothetical protein KIPB_007460 [Kipferlia bialata]|eukprot:g7460.t1
MGAPKDGPYPLLPYDRAVGERLVELVQAPSFWAGESEDASLSHRQYLQCIHICSCLQETVAEYQPEWDKCTRDPSLFYTEGGSGAPTLDSLSVSVGRMATLSLRLSALGQPMLGLVAAALSLHALHAQSSSMEDVSDSVPMRSLLSPLCLSLSSACLSLVHSTPCPKGESMRREVHSRQTMWLEVAVIHAQSIWTGVEGSLTEEGSKLSSHAACAAMLHALSLSLLQGRCDRMSTEREGEMGIVVAAARSLAESIQVKGVGEEKEGEIERSETESSASLTNLSDVDTTEGEREREGEGDGGGNRGEGQFEVICSQDDSNDSTHSSGVSREIGHSVSHTCDILDALCSHPLTLSEGQTLVEALHRDPASLSPLEGEGTSLSDKAHTAIALAARHISLGLSPSLPLSLRRLLAIPLHPFQPAPVRGDPLDVISLLQAAIPRVLEAAVQLYQSVPKGARGMCALPLSAVSCVLEGVPDQGARAAYARECAESMLAESDVRLGMCTSHLMDCMGRPEATDVPAHTLSPFLSLLTNVFQMVQLCLHLV